LLARLVARGAVELYEERPRRKLYQAAERLYNIYYLMRRRGQPADRVRAAVEEAIGPVPVRVDELIRIADAPAQVVIAVMLELELAGKLTRHPGNAVSWSA